MARRPFRRMDWGLLFSTLALVTIGLVLVYSASQGPALGGRGGLFTRQLMWLGLGSFAYLVMAVIPFRFWEEYSHFLYTAAMVILVLVLLIGVERDGAKRWLVVAGFQFQPSEMAKLATILLLARVLARPRFDPGNLSHMVPAIGIALLPFVLILVEPDLGTSLSLPVALVAMLFWAGLPLVVILTLGAPVMSIFLSWNLWVWLAYIVMVTVFLMFTRMKKIVMVGVLAVSMTLGAATPMLWNTLKPYQQKRILTLIHPEVDPLGSGYQPFQSKVAIGSGGWLGKGFLQGTQKGLAFLPHTHTDFIFSVLGEEFGFLGCVAVLLLFTWFIARGLSIAAKSRSRFASLMVVGICSMVMFHVVVNVAMTMALAPVTGLPLPFLSYGGTFLLVTMAGAGLLMNAALRRNEV